eukprot:Em0017g654a
MMSRFRKQMACELSIGALHPLKKADDAIQDVMEHHSEDDDVIESESTSSLNSDTDSNDFLVPECENPGPDPDDLTTLKWGREHYIRCIPEEKSRQVCEIELYLVGAQNDVGKRASMTLFQLSKFIMWPCRNNRSCYYG